MEVNKYKCEFMLHEYVEMETTDNTDMAQCTSNMPLIQQGRRISSDWNVSSPSYTYYIPMPPLPREKVPLTLRANLATMRAPTPARADTLGSQPSMRSKIG